MKRQKVDPTYNVGEDAIQDVIYTKPNLVELLHNFLMVST